MIPDGLATVFAAGREFKVLGTVCRSISTPGHMVVHKTYHFPELGILFTGDTLINGACGRILDGTAAQLLASLRERQAPCDPGLTGE